MYVQLETDLLFIGDSILTDRHHASNGNDEAEDPQNRIGGIRTSSAAFEQIDPSERDIPSE